MKILLILLLFSFLGGCSSTPDFNSDYPHMKKINHIYEKVDFNQAKQIFTEGTGIIVLAYNTNKYSCPYCITVMPILNEVALAEKWQKIYYLDIYDIRKDNTEEYQYLLNLISLQVDDLLIKNDKLTLAVPDVYFIKDGVIKGHHIATLSNGNNQFLNNLDDKEIDELKTIYHNLFELLE